MGTTSELIPVTSHVRDFSKWVGEVSSVQRSLHPINELFAEHHLIDAVITAMEREVRKLRVHGQLRVESWEALVDFFGNFALQVHQRKEEKGLLEFCRHREIRIRPQVGAEIAKGHSDISGITVALYQGVSDGDWEKVLRASSVYLSKAREHLPRVEHAVYAPARMSMSEEDGRQLRLRFDELERFGLGEQTRGDYLLLARQVCARVGLEDELVI